MIKQEHTEAPWQYQVVPWALLPEARASLAALLGCSLLVFLSVHLFLRQGLSVVALTVLKFIL